MKQVVALIGMLWSLNLSAQQEGSLRLYLTPPAEAVAIDGELLDFGNSIALKPGKYFLQAWSPHKELLDTIVEIKAGETVNFFYRFENSKSYKNFQTVSSDYSRQKSLNFVLPAATTALLGGALVYTLIKGKDLQEQTEEKYLDYKYAGYDMELAKKEFEESQDKYRAFYYAQFVELAALAVSSYFLYKGIKWLKNNPKPELEKDKNPFTVDQVGFMPNQYGGYGVGLVIKLN